VTDWETVRALDTEEEAALLAGLLEEEGIPVAVESQIFHLGAAAYGQLGQVHVRVPADALERARALLLERERGAGG
jgi:hypothetical protein